MHFILLNYQNLKFRVAQKAGVALVPITSQISLYRHAHLCVFPHGASKHLISTCLLTGRFKVVPFSASYREPTGTISLPQRCFQCHRIHTNIVCVWQSRYCVLPDSKDPYYKQYYYL